MDTAVLHRAFGLGPYIRRLLPLLAGSGQVSAPIPQLSLLQGPVVLITSRPGFFSATPSGFASVCLDPRGQPLSRSYGLSLPSSLAEYRSSALVRLHQPTCVGLRYGRLHN